MNPSDPPLQPCFLWSFSFSWQRPSSTPADSCSRTRPRTIASAQKIFIANGGMDAFSLQASKSSGSTEPAPNDSLYAAVESWGQPQLVSAPADADLVLVIRFTAPLVGENGGWAFQRVLANTRWQFQTELTIYDAKSHFPLWTLTQPVRPANLKGTWHKNMPMLTPPWTATSIAVVADRT